MNHTPNPAAGQPNLSAAHVRELAASGITPEAAAANGIHTETDMKCVGRLLNWTGARAFGDCLVFPYFAADGSPTGYVRVKPTKPRACNPDTTPPVTCGRCRGRYRPGRPSSYLHTPPGHGG